MAKPSTQTIVQAILKTTPDATAAEIAKKAKAKGVAASTEWIMEVVYRLRGAAKKAALPAKAVAPVAAVRPARPRPSPAAAVSPVAATADLTGVLANVALVHRVVAACGGVEPARQAAEAVRACGGVAEFLQHLDLVAGLQAAPPA